MFISKKRGSMFVTAYTGKLILMAFAALILLLIAGKALTTVNNQNDPYACYTNAILASNTKFMGKETIAWRCPINGPVKITAKDLNKVISLDPVLVGKVLKLVNSAYYSLPNKVTSLVNAIIMLGINTIKNLALSTAVLGNMKRKDRFKSLNVDGFWRHSIGVGVASKLIATKIGIPANKREEYFIGGLLHDIGKIPLNEIFPEEYLKVIRAADFKKDELVTGTGATLIRDSVKKVDFDSN